MITTKRPNTDNYTQVGFIEAKDNQGNYQNIDKIYDNQGNIVFQQGYLNEYQGADDFGIPAIGKPLVDYTIWGNTVQDGTPTPDNPIEPEFCGDLVSIELDEPLRAVGNYKDTLDLGTGVLTRVIRKVIYTGEENWEVGSEYDHTFQCQDNGGYTNERPNGVSTHYVEGTRQIFGNTNCFLTAYSIRTLICEMSCNTVDEFKGFLRQKYAAGTPVVIYRATRNIITETIPIPDGLIGTIEGTVTQSGTPTPDNPIEPVFNGKLLPNGKYQVYATYKIPISSAGQTKTIYLGQVQTTRQIKKLVLTGEEDWAGVYYTYALGFDVRAYGGGMLQGLYTVLSTNYQSVITVPSGRARIGKIFKGVEYGTIGAKNSVCVGIQTIDEAGSIAREDIDELKSYLAQQYAAGTPVTVWYVLAAPELGIVNEPLCRIGDYADSITFEQAGVEIPTLKKPNTTIIDVKTSLEPSEVDVTYRGSTKPQYDLFLAKNGDSFEAQDGQSLYIGGNP